MTNFVPKKHDAKSIVDYYVFQRHVPSRVGWRLEQKVEPSTPEFLADKGPTVESAAVGVRR